MSILEWLGFTPHMRAYVTVQWKSYDSGFHLHFERRVRAFGLKGWMRVQRQPMYSVLEAEIEGRKHQIENFLQDIKAAPAQALASNANVQWMSYKGVYHNFQVRH